MSDEVNLRTQNPKNPVKIATKRITTAGKIGLSAPASLWEPSDNASNENSPFFEATSVSTTS